MLAMLLLGSALAQQAPPADPPTPSAAESAPARDVAAEVALALTLPAGGLGLGGGFQGAVLFPLGQRVELGPAVTLRAPTAADGVLEDPGLATSLAWQTRLTTLAFAARADILLPIDEDWAGRGALELGVVGLSQRTTGGAGVTTERAVAPWISPRLGIQRHLRSGWLLFDLSLHYAPASLLVTGGDIGGTGVSAAVGYRFMP